jgi:hypothetical protein
MLYFSKRANYVISFPVGEEVFLKFPTLIGVRGAGVGVVKVIFFLLYIQVKKIDLYFGG